MMLFFGRDTLVSHRDPGLDTSEEDLVDWDAWLTPEALQDDECLMMNVWLPHNAA